MNNFKLVALSIVAATAIGFTGCGSSSSDNNDNGGNTVDGTTIKTAYDYFVRDKKYVGDGAIHLDDKTSLSGVNEANIWKGKVDSNDPLEDYTRTASGYSTPCTPHNVDENLSAVISTDTTLDATKTYGINGKVNVKSGVTLTIPAGVTMVGMTPKSFMVIEPGAKLIAKGTLAKPIVFTSKVDAECKSGDNLAGEWGGLVLAGNAYTHYKDNKYEADESVSFGSTTHDHDGDSSGDLEYVLVKHSGYEVEKDKELNGLSLAGVGSGTILKNIAIIGGLDDGTEIWGGTVGYNGLYVYNAADDSVDTDLGYRGPIQNVLVRQVHVDSTNNHDSSAMEFGNDHNTIVTDDSNCTQPDIKNFTAYVKGGGFYNKYDAGFKWDNVKFISAKTKDEQQVHFRGQDSYNTGGKHIDGAGVSFFDSKVTLTDDNTFSKKNSKAQ